MILRSFLCSTRLICRGADPDRIKEEIEAIIGLDCSNAIPCSAKTGMGVPEILQSVVDRVPPPADTVKEPTKALIFDSYYDPLSRSDCLLPCDERKH